MSTIVDRKKCTNCRRNIARSFSIECAECSNTFLCGDCFCAGVELGTHKNNHKYKVADCLEYPLFVKDWSVSEELAMLEAIEKSGVGNWKTIAEYIGTNKTTRQVEEHYWEHFMGVHGYCLPAQVIWKDQLQDTASFCPEAREGASVDVMTMQTTGNGDLYRVNVTEGYERGQPVRRDEGFTGLGNAKSGNKDKQDVKDKIAQLPGNDLPGFYPLRGDFDNEYENDADKMIAEMEFSLDEHPSERELKLQVVRIYNHKLQERNRRKEFVIERGLIDFKHQQQQDKRRTKEERDLVGRLRVFARFQSREEHEALVEGMLRAGRLRQQIELYRTYRAMGVRTLEQARQYETSRRIRERDIKARKHKESAPYLFQPQNGANGGHTAAAETAVAIEPEPAIEGKGRRRGRDSSSNLAAEGDGGSSSTLAVGSSRKRAAVSAADDNSRGGGGFGSMGSPNRGGIDDSEAAALLTKAPGGDLLAELELHFCVKVGMLPLHYLAAKDAIVREAYRNGSLTQEGVKRLLKFDADGTEKIYDFFVKEMLINDPSGRVASSRL